MSGCSTQLINGAHGKTAARCTVSFISPRGGSRLANAAHQDHRALRGAVGSRSGLGTRTMKRPERQFPGARRTTLRRGLWACTLAALLVWMGSAPSTGQQIPGQDGLQPILHYIGDGWVGLSRSLTECKTVSDPKTEKSVLYFPADMAVAGAAQQLQQKCGVRIEHLPGVLHRLGEADMKQIVGHG